MADASGKLPNGAINGHFVDFGAQNQCIQVRSNGLKRNFDGKHCLVGLRWPLPEYNGVKLPAASVLTRSLTNGKTGAPKQWLTSLSKFYPVLYVEPFTLGVCFPSGCAASEIEAVLGQFARKHAIPLHVTVDARCATKKNLISLNPPSRYNLSDPSKKLSM